MGTGIRILLREEMPRDGVPDSEDFPSDPPSPGERAEQKAYERGELIYVGWHVFADLEEDGRRFRVGGSWGWERHLGDLLGDLRIGDMNITRWGFYAAPFKIELSPMLQERLVAAWRGNPPRQAPAHEDFYEH